MNRIKVWPHMTIVAVLVAVIAGLGVTWWIKHERTASAEALPNVARIQRVDGEVAFNNALYDQDEGTNAQWIRATPNQPFSVGDQIYTRDNSRASLAFTGRNFARLDPNTALDVVTLADGRTQVALRDGSAFFDVGYPGDLFEVATPYGAVDFAEPGLYNVGFDNDGNVLVSVLSGLARVVGLAGSGQINKGEILTLASATAANVIMSRLDGRDAGSLVDDYYRYQYPDVYDGRYNDYDGYLSDPFYYDPYRRNASYQYVNSVIPGVNDLDYYGDWQDVDGYGHAWRPRVDAGWSPYQHGYWFTDYPYGATWVSNEPWGFAPYHYGRWANVGNQWYWIPEGVNATPLYAPALVAFVPVNDDEVGWVPLAPGEQYAPRYYDQNWQPHYLTRADIVPAQLVNLAIPGALTVVPVNAFGGAIDPRMVRRIDPHVLPSLRPTLEPLMMTPLRNAVLNSAWGRGKIDLPPGIAKKLQEQQVFVGAEPIRPRFRRDLARSLRVERLSEEARRQKFKTNEGRRGDDSREARRDEEGRDNDRVERERRQEIQRLSNEAARGNREARQQARRLEQEQREQERARRKDAQQPRGERVGNPGRQRAERPPRAEQRSERSQGNRGESRGKSEDRGNKGKGRGRP